MVGERSEAGRRRTRSAGVTLALLAVTAAARAQDATVAGTVSSPYPTFENLSLTWEIEGDANANGVVTVRFRAEGDAEFRPGHPLFRVPAGENAGFSWGDRHSGSLFGLSPGTTYEIELTLDDPDGGSAVETLTATTRAIPTAAADARIIDVTPATIDAALATAEAGDVLRLGDGTYGSIEVTNDGAEGRPLVLMAAEPLGAVVEGEIRLDGRAFVHVEGLQVHGRFKLNDAEGIVVRDCVIDTDENGIVSYASGVRNAAILNNVITGPTVWRASALGVDGDNLGEGVQLTGPGNVIAHNRVRGFRDCVSLLEEDEAVEQVSIDVYGNDLDGCADDAVEADYAMGNVRVYQNRITNSFMGISSQPSLGGPTWFVRNVMYGVIYEAFKLHNGSNGDVLYHNTVVKSGDALAVYTDDAISRATVRNNLFLGGPGGTYGGYDSGAGAVVNLRPADASCSLDYDGFGSVGTGTFEGRVGEVRFTSLDELRALTTEAHAVEVTLDVFADAVEFPADPFAAPAAPGFGLAAGSAAVDRGVPLANVNDGFAGDAPDLGAFELGAAEVIYGPGGDLVGPGSGGAGGAASMGGSPSGGEAGAATPGAGGDEPASGGASGGAASGGEGGAMTPGAGGDEPASGGAAGSTASQGGEGGVATTATGGAAPSPGGAAAVGGSGSSAEPAAGDGPTATGGAPGAGGSGPGPDPEATDSGDDGGCGCALVGVEGHRARALAWAILLAGAALGRRGRRR